MSKFSLVCGTNVAIKVISLDSAVFGDHGSAGSIGRAAFLKECHFHN